MIFLFVTDAQRAKILAVKLGKQKGFVAERAPQGPGWFHSSFFFFWLLFNPEGNRGRTRKGIKFWIERLIINLSRELILGVLGRS